jgi:hypothetical protein
VYTSKDTKPFVKLRHRVLYSRAKWNIEGQNTAPAIRRASQVIHVDICYLDATQPAPAPAPASKPDIGIDESEDADVITYPVFLVLCDTLRDPGDVANLLWQKSR